MVHGIRSAAVGLSYLSLVSLSHSISLACPSRYLRPLPLHCYSPSAVLSHRRRDDPRASANSTHALAFTSLCYTADGQCVLAGGNSKYVCIYQLAQKMLLRKFVISDNLSLDGILPMLNSKRMTEAGPVSMLDADDSDEELHRRQDPSLPGSRRGDFSSRNTPLVARTKSVQFSPTGLQWCAASTEGVLIYSLDDTLTFHPSELDLEITPQNAKAAMREGRFAEALTMALCLQEAKLIFHLYVLCCTCHCVIL